MSGQVAVSKVTTQAVEQGGALAKLITFSFALAVLPLSSYYGTLDRVWNGNGTYAAITAIVMANAVLVVFIIMSVLEERKATESASPRKGETKKTK